jgi:hypothetical protein
VPERPESVAKRSYLVILLIIAANRLILEKKKKFGFEEQKNYKIDCPDEESKSDVLSFCSMESILKDAFKKRKDETSHIEKIDK